MKNLATLCGALVLGLLVGCGAAELEDGSEAQVSGEAAPVPLTPEQLQRLMEEAAQNPPKFEMATCPAANTCGTEFSSCNTWSGYTTCGSLSACNFTGCRQCYIDPDIGRVCEPTGSQSQPRYRFQTCFNVLGASCTNVEISTTTVCGCNQL